MHCERIIIMKQREKKHVKWLHYTRNELVVDCSHLQITETNIRNIQKPTSISLLCVHTTPPMSITLTSEVVGGQRQHRQRGEAADRTGDAACVIVRRLQQ